MMDPRIHEFTPSEYSYEVCLRALREAYETEKLNKPYKRMVAKRHNMLLVKSRLDGTPLEVPE